MIQKLTINFNLLFSKSNQHSEILKRKTFGNTVIWLRLGIFFMVSFVNAQTTFYSRQSGDWNANTTWSTISNTGAAVAVGVHPIAGDIVNISINHIVTLNGDAACASIFFPDNVSNTSNSELIFAGFKLDVSGDIRLPRANGSRLNILNVGSGILNVGGSLNFITSGGGTIRHKLLISTGTVNILGSVTCSNSAGVPIIEFTGNGFLNVSGNFFATGLPNITGGSGIGTINLNGTNQSLSGIGYNNLVLSGTGTKTFLGIATISSNLSIATGAIANLSTFTHTANSLTLGSVNTAAGSWGGTTSPATNINSTYFITATGIVNVATGCTTSPAITTQPSVPTAICSGSGTQILSVVATGTGLTYQWRRNATNLNNGGVVSGANSSTLTLTNPATVDAGSYDVVISGTCMPAVISNSVNVIVNALPSTPTIGTITSQSCTLSTGSVALSNLPSGNWTITTIPATTSTLGSGTTATISGLSPNTYKFIVTNDVTGCTSLASIDVIVSGLVTNTYNSGWSNGIPTSNQNLVFASDYASSNDLNGCSCIINAGKTVTINSGHTLTITNGITVSTDYNLIFENNASLVQTNNVINTGSIIYKRNSAPMKNFDYSYWSSPVAGQTLFDLSPNTFADKYMSYSGTGWQISYGGTAVMQPGIGYIIRTPKGGTWPAPHPEVVAFPYSQPVQFKGVPNNGNITSSQSMVTGNFYLIGNPYPSALNADEFLFNNTNNHTVLNGTIYLWTHNTAVANLKYTSDDYATYNGVGGIATSGGAVPSGYIAAGQSFFASAKANGTVEFNNSMRAAGNNGNNAQFFKPGEKAKTTKLERHRLWLNMTNPGGVFKQTLIGYVEGATNAYDDNFDGLTFDGNSYVDFYSTNATDNLAIQGRALPFVDTDVVPMGYRSTVAGSFTIAINKADGALATQKIYLEDKQTGTINELTAQNYTFNTTAGTFNNRFVLRYTNKTLGTGDFETVENSITVVSQDKAITIGSAKENLSKVFIYDISGKQLYKKQNVGNLELSIQHLAFAQQVLLIKVVLENGYTTTKKLIFK
jgi:hypothetical protein